MSAPLTAVDGAVITIGADTLTHGQVVNCSQCGYVTSDPGDVQYLEGVASHHVGWHEAEYERERARR